MTGGGAPRDDSYWRSEMLRIIAQATPLVGRGREAFFDPANEVEFSAARMLVIDLDVAAEKLSEGFRSRHPDVPWRALARARDKYAHHYEGIDRLVVWNLLVDRLPAIARSLERS